MKTAKERDRAYSRNRMDSNLRSDTLRQVGVPEDFIDPVRSLDFNEIENSYPEIAEWLMDSAGLFNEPMFEDNVHSSIPLDQTHNISINDPNQYWNLTDIIGERKASEMGDFMDMVERAEDIWRDLNETQRKYILEDSGLVGQGMWVGDDDIRDDNLSNVINHITPDAYKLDLYDLILDTYGSSKYGEGKASEGEWEYSGVDLEDHMDIEEEGGRTYATCEHCGWHEEWDDSDRSGNAPVDVMSNHLSRKHGITESKSTEILGFDELLSEDLTYNEIVELTKGLPIDEIPEKLRHAGMKLQFDPDFKAGDNPYIGDWRESFSKELQALEYEYGLEDAVYIIRISKRDALEEIQSGGRIMVDDHGKYFKEGY